MAWGPIRPFRFVEYICIDNGCSRAYRRDKPVLNGIEIDAAGNILEEKTTVENGDG
ncbi:hypothetical protein ACFLRT_05005 [Acidobacteriota bacterium]